MVFPVVAGIYRLQLIWMPEISSPRSNAPGDLRKIKPHLHATEMRTFRTNGRGDSGAKMAGWPDVTRQLRMHLPHLGHLVHGRLVNFFLGVETSAHGPFVQ